jgi:hypothetical protein
MKRIVIETDFHAGDKLVFACPFCNTTVIDDNLMNDDNEYGIIECPHTLFWAVNEYLEYQSPQMKKILKGYDESDIEDLNIYFEGGLLEKKNLDNIVIYELCDSSISPFNNGDTVYFGFVNK